MPPFRFSRFFEQRRRLVAALAAVGLAVAVAFLYTSPPPTEPGLQTNRKKPAPSGAVTLELSDSQIAALKIEQATTRPFPQEKQAVGSVDFNQNRLVSVFPPYQGRVISVSFNVGDAVEKDQVLFTIDSPDLLTAESNLIAAAGTQLLQSRTLNRTRSLVKIGGFSQQQLDQAVSDQQTAEGALKAARDAVRMFGKTSEEVDKIVAERLADPRLVVKSPLSGYVTARAAVPGQFVQPGVAPAPYVVADTSTMWMVANVVESDAPALRVGQEVKASVAAYPGRFFDGKITVLGPSVDPATRRQFVRIEIADPHHLLRAGMFADFTIRTGDPVSSTAAPASAIVREGDGTMTCWVTTDRRRFTRRTVMIGQRRDGFVQILSGLAAEELIVGDGAVFLSNQAALGKPD
ncbi:efflux RND transporter periplasmic adaptor subunit [Methylocystis sp. MJC1]|jgi:cobalt-zinc-cadmium efflux system membrane fusion protein|uniref:efflux RND transporter periplasmic adaptor subunit n=1 Tax=Methylocystis sp. MJC1 TaxID=2654282 RepID=UPI0013EAEDF0|nr:efflux RND transporter periplasmic adaptor subunit [Methylocystis sp. MJC1]KAF2989888.1 Macrolide export protein MacA [Methylocystis sp. MJC1]MBU6528343.1 efflux RND transporter periplasmic adaptor subunit [Methylocystis sp. MJC1]UZX11248.1 efflux RND transporter periplasmic adaptor subunit [Methylocystis sp. MJC1]